MDPTRKSLIAELIGTFGFVFLSAGAVMALIATGNQPAQDAAAYVAVAFAHGLAFIAMLAAVRSFSTGYLNPAITAGLLVAGRMKLGQAVAAVVMQLLGAALAAAVLRYGLPSLAGGTAAATPDLASSLGITAGQGFLIEAVLTFFLVIVVLGAAEGGGAPVAIGAAAAAGVLLGGRLTGAALNPARVFGPALISGHWENHAIYWGGPIVGAVVAGLIYGWLLAPSGTVRGAEPTPAEAPTGA